MSKVMIPVPECSECHTAYNLTLPLFVMGTRSTGPEWVYVPSCKCAKKKGSIATFQSRTDANGGPLLMPCSSAMIVDDAEHNETEHTT